MKKVLLLVIVFLLSFGFTFAGNFSVRPSIGLALGSEDALRGATVGAHAQYNILNSGIYLGLNTNVSYDSWYSNVSLPLTLTLGLGQNFYILAGTTFDLTPARNPLTKKITKTADIMSTFGIGGYKSIIPISEKMKLGIVSELTYTNYSLLSSSESALENTIGGIVGLIANIKLNLMVSLDMLL